MVFKQPELVDKIMSLAGEKYPYWDVPKYRLATFKEDGGVVGALAEIKLNF